MSVKTGPLIHVIPSLNLSNVEHPAVIKNVDKAEASLGGQSSIAKVGDSSPVSRRLSC